MFIVFDATYEFPPRDSLKHFSENMPYFPYMSILYKNRDHTNENNDFALYRGSMLEFDNSPRKKKESAIYENYSPEQFFMIDKHIIEWTRNKSEKSKVRDVIFI